MLEEPKCRSRTAALQVIARIKLKDARAKVKDLAEHGGPGDGDKVLIFGCNSQLDAKSVLEQLE